MPIRNGNLPLDTKTDSPATSNSKTNEEAAPSLDPIIAPSSQPPTEEPTGSSHKSPPPNLITSPVIPLMGPGGVNRAMPHPVKLEHHVSSSSVRKLMSHCITYVGPQLNFKITT